ncbi:MAG: hypothetical protein ACTH36_12180 [Pseudoalteromonas nigrifaciens]
MFEAIGLIVGIIGTAIAIYQAAIINESKKRKNELQYLFAGINAAAVQKQQAWQNQIALLPKPSTPEEWAIAHAYIRARDDVAEIANLTSALEGTIDPDNSAIVAMMDKYKTIVDKNNLMNPPTGFEAAAKSANNSMQPTAKASAD